MSQATDSSGDSAPPKPTVWREIIFRSGVAESTRVFPARPKIPEPTRIDVLGRDLGVFPKMDDQPGTWLLSNPKDEGLEAIRVLSSRDAESSGGDPELGLLGCGCGVVSRCDLEAEEAGCLLCETPVKSRDHHCPNLAGRPMVAMTATARSCPFCTLHDEATTSPSAPGARQQEKRGESVPSSESRSKGAKPEIEEELPRQTIVNPSASSETRPPTRSTHLRWFVLLPGILLATLIVASLRWGSRDGEVLDPKPSVTVKESIPTITGIARYEEPKDTAPDWSLPDTPPATPEEEARALATQVRQAVQQLEESLATGDIDQLKKTLSLPRTVLDALTADSEHGQLLGVARESKQMSEAIQAASPKDLEKALVSWQRLVECSPEFASNSGLYALVEEAADARARHLVENKAWKEIEPTLSLIKSQVPALVKRKRVSELEPFAEHWRLLEEAQNATLHRGLSLLQEHRPPVALAEEHRVLLAKLLRDFEEQDKASPDIRPEGFKLLTGSQTLELYFEIYDRYGIFDVTLTFWGKSFSGARTLKLKVGSDNRWLARIPVEEVEGRRIFLEVKAWDRSRNESVLRGTVTRGVLRRNRWKVDWE